MKKILILIMIILSVISLNLQAANGKMSGEGTEISPYLVEDYIDLQSVGDHPGSVYRLKCDIDASNSHYTNYQYFPQSFRGTLHGGGHTIRNLYILKSNSGSDSLGLFSLVETDALIDSLTLLGTEISGNKYIGAIAGVSRGVISHCQVDTASEVRGTENVGGLVGSNNGEIYFSSFYGSVYYTNQTYVLGITFGGLVGSMSGGTIKNCSVDGSVSGSSKDGGFIGQLIDGIIMNCSSKTSLSGTTTLGGFVGYQTGGTIKNCAAEGNVRGDHTAGGFVGVLSKGTIQGCYSGVAISLSTAKNGYNGGGFVGNMLDGSIEGCHATGKISGYYTNGGFVGYLTKGTISKSSASGTIECTFDSIGGFAGGIAAGTILEKCVASGTVSGRSIVGGFAGVNHGEIRLGAASEKSSIKPLRGKNSIFTGGFAGINKGTILTSCALGTITISDSVLKYNNIRGGFTGSSDGSIENCFSLANFLIDSSVNIQTGDSAKYLSGFTGYNTGKIRNSYAAGKAFRFDTVLHCTGIAAINYGGTITDCYWDTLTLNSDIGVDSTTVTVNVSGKTTAEMKLQSTFTGWDFTSIWTTSGDSHYPDFLFVNHPPEIILTAFEVSSNGNKKIGLASVVRDSDGDPVFLRILKPAENGSFFIDSNSIEYTPAFDFSGIDSLCIWAGDGMHSDTAWIKITVENKVAIRALQNAVTARKEFSIVQISRDLIDISFALPACGQIQLEMYSLNGQRVRAFDQGMMNAGSQRLQLPTTAIKSGIYSIELRINGQVSAKTRMIKYR